MPANSAREYPVVPKRGAKRPQQRTNLDAAFMVVESSVVQRPARDACVAQPPKPSMERKQ